MTLALIARSWNAWMAADFRRERPYWLQLVWTGLFSVPVALLFTLIGFVFYAQGDAWTSLANWWYWFKPNLLACAAVCYGVHLLFEVATWIFGVERIRRLQHWQRAVFFAGVPMLGIAGGWPAAVSLAGERFSWPEGGGGRAINIGFVLFGVLLSLVMYLYFDGKARREAAERRTVQARLRLLQAQIEPHFLFNTLANVLSLIDADAPKAKQMLETFIEYLRSSLSRLRVDESTLGAELDMAEAYLRLLQVRMDDRLHFRIEADAAARAARVPPLLLQPLVENAIHHGLEPKLEGGEVVVRARREGDTLVIDVDDDGLGLEAPPRPGRRGSGIALANVRERLAALQGSFSLDPLDRRTRAGTNARITLPYQSEPATP